MAELGIGEIKRSRGVNDFLRWYESDLPKVDRPEIGEGVPGGVEPLADRYGTFGAHAEMEGGPLEKFYIGKSYVKMRQIGCTDSEAKPYAPCSATGECDDLQRMAHTFKDSVDQAQVAAQEAVQALDYAKFLRDRVMTVLKRGTFSKYISKILSIDEDMVDKVVQEDNSVRNIYGPLRQSWPLPKKDHKHVLLRTMARWDEDKRIADYIQHVEDDRPLKLPMLSLHRGDLGIGPTDPKATCCSEGCGMCIDDQQVPLDDPVDLRTTSDGTPADEDEIEEDMKEKIVKDCVSLPLVVAAVAVTRSLPAPRRRSWPLDGRQRRSYWERCNTGGGLEFLCRDDCRADWLLQATLNSFL